jgi:AraC-like DNA-binding protein
LAKRAGWSVKGMADHCGVSLRTLERHFIKKMGQTPVEWLNEHRQKHALELLRLGSSIKETSAELGYKHGSHLTRDFKKQWGCCPTQLNQKNSLEPLIRANPR